MKNTALITGASSGIGKELAYIHAATKGDLVIVARREAELKTLQTELENKYQVKVKIIVKDLTQKNACKEIYNEVVNSGISIDYLINNAGFGGIGKFYERNWAKDEAMIDLNIKALVELTRLFLPDFVKKNSGKILNVASTAAFIPGPLQAVYYASKAFVVSFSQAINEELFDKNITVSTLCPGPTETEFGKISEMDKTSLFDKTFSAKLVANKGYNGMLKGKLIIVTGIALSARIMLAFAPFTPRRMVLKMVRKMQEVKK